MLHKAVRIINLIGRKLARRHIALEHDVHLLECTVLRLGQTEPSPDRGQEIQNAPEEGLTTQAKLAIRLIEAEKNELVKVEKKSAYRLALGIPRSG